MNDIYKINISFDAYILNETIRIYYSVSVDDIINDDYLWLILDYHNEDKRARYNRQIKERGIDLPLVEISPNYKQKTDKKYDNVEEVVNDVYLVKKALFDKGRNVCIDILKGVWGMDCCEDCGWSYQWEFYNDKSIIEE